MRLIGRSVLVLSSLLYAGTAFSIEITDTRRLTSNGADQYNPVISGDFVVYTDTRAGNADIYLYNLLSGQETNITNDPANQLLNDVGGDFVVYSDYRTGVPQVWTYHIPSGAACRLTFSSDPQVSPSVGGNLVVFQSMSGSDSHIGYFDLATIDPDNFDCSAVPTSAPKTLPLGTGRQFLPRTSGKWVVYQEATTAGPRVFAFDREASAIKQAPEHQKNQLLPDIDGGHLAYIEDDGNNRDVVFFDLETNTFAQVTQDNARQNYPSISGNFIAFEDDRSGNLDIYLYDLASGLFTQLTNDPTNQYLNSIDDTNVVFTDASAGNLDVVMVSFKADDLPIPEECNNPAPPATLASIALDDTANMSKREFIFWPFLHHSFTGGTHKWVSDHKRITYKLEVAEDMPEANLSLHVQLAKSELNGALRAAGLDQQGGLVLRVNGQERRWYDPANSTGKVTLVAERTYAPNVSSDGTKTFDSARELLIPPWLQVTAGWAGHGHATLSFDGGRCDYHGWGKRYWLDDCTNNARAGDAISTTSVSVHIEDGDCDHHRTEVTAKLYASEASGTDAWIDVSFTTALKAGSNEITLEGPGYGSAYLKYRAVDFRDGGTLTVKSKPVCLPDPTLLPQCHDANMRTLFEQTFTRDAGEPATQTAAYTSTEAGGATLCVTNGDAGGAHRVSSAVIWHNDDPTLGPSAFGPQVAETAATITTLFSNTVGVQLSSAPGSFVTLRVVKAAPPPPPPPPTMHVHGCSNSGASGIFSLLLPLCALFFLRLFSSTRLLLGRSPPSPPARLSSSSRTKSR